MHLYKVPEIGVEGFLPTMPVKSVQDWVVTQKAVPVVHDAGRLANVPHPTPVVILEQMFGAMQLVLSCHQSLFSVAIHPHSTAALSLVPINAPVLSLLRK